MSRARLQKGLAEDSPSVQLSSYGRRCYLCITASALLAAIGLGQNVAREEYPVSAKLARTYLKHDERVFELLISIDPDFRIYANPVGNTDLDFAKTTVAAQLDGKPVKADIRYPEGRLVKAGQEEFRVYTGDVKISVTIKENMLTAPLEFTVRVQPTDPRGIHFLKAKRITVPFSKEKGKESNDSPAPPD